MALGSRKLAQGTKLKMESLVTPGSFATIAYLDDIGFPNQTRAAVDFSDHDTEETMDKAASRLKDGGTVSIAGHFAPLVASQAGLLAAFDDGLTRSFQIWTPDDEWVCSFDGFVSSHGGTAPAESGAGKIKFSGEITVTGNVRYAEEGYY